MRIHTVRRRDWRDYREIRLAALKNEPSAFASTWQEEASLTAAQWRDWAQRSQDGETGTIAVAVDDTGRWVGLAGGYRPGDRGADTELISMWVAPECRGSPCVFTTPMGTPIDPSNDNREFKKLLGRAGLPPVRLHDLRHTAASLLLAQGVPARVVMEILGHSQIALTMNTYSHVAPELSREAAERMASALWQDADEGQADAEDSGQGVGQ